jgi:plastocyanin
MRCTLHARRVQFAFAVMCACAAPGAAELKVQVLSAAGLPFAGAVVYATPLMQSPHGELPRATIDQVNRTFVPIDSVIQAGTAVAFPNSDNIRHSVYSFSPAKVFTLKLYAGTPSSPVVFDKPGVVVLGCNIHDSMVAWVLVVDTPYFARTDRSGVATLANLPPGDYRLRAWHSPMADELAGESLHVESGVLPTRQFQLPVNEQDDAMAMPH